MPEPQVIPYASVDRRLAAAVRNFALSLERLTLIMDETAARMADHTRAERRTERQEMRDWAAEHGITVSTSGRAPTKVREAWELHQQGQDDQAVALLTRKKQAKLRVVGDSKPKPSDLIRAWAAEQGYTVAPRGRIPVLVVAAYTAAHTEDAGQAG